MTTHPATVRYLSTDYIVEHEEAELWGTLYELETAHDVAIFMWGRDFAKYRIYKRGHCFEWTDGDLRKFESALEAFTP
jgi:hypothetical protein